MRKVWELTEDKRRKIQDGNVREMIIGLYAPCEPLIMENILNFLKYEKKYPLALVHKIFDRFASMTVYTTVVTFDEVCEFIEGIPDDFAIAVGPCACRIHTAEELGPDARDLSAGNLEYCQQTPLNVDIQIATCGEKFGELEAYSPISKKELLELEKKCFNMGLVANIYMMFGGDAGICHCSSATCVPLMANQAIGKKSTVIKKGAFWAKTDFDSCTGNGDCLKVCHFDSRKIVERNGKLVSVIIGNGCYGCGLCAAVCPEKAISMTQRKEE
jgi:NAD-dependent dihydropyrimidine dehydrogenase PreA subunit